VVAGPGALADALRANGIETGVVDMKRLERTANPFRIARHIRAISRASRELAEAIAAKGVDIVHSNGAMAHLYAGEAAARAGVPCLWHSRDILNLGPVGSAMTARAARVVAVSEAVRDHLVRSGVPAERVRLVRNGIDLSAFPADRASVRAAARSELGLDERAFVVGTAGVFVEWKRHEDFVRAFARLCEREIADCAGRAAGQAVDVAGMVPARAVIFGDDIFGQSGRYVFELKQLADELAGERLVFAGWRDDLPRVLAALDVFVSASEKEPFGRVLVEAMAAGLPVVATDSGAKREIVADGRTGVVVAHRDPEALGDALFDLMCDPARCEALGAAGARRAAEEFGVERAAREIEDVYDEISPSWA